MSKASDKEPTAPATPAAPRQPNTYVERKTLGGMTGRVITIGWMDAKRAPSTFIFLNFDSYNYLVEGNKGQRLIIPKHAVAYLSIEKEVIEAKEQEPA